MEDVTHCPHCRHGEESDGLNLQILYAVYRCPTCHGEFCSFCGGTAGVTLVCPHCRAEWVDPAASREPPPQGAQIIGRAGQFWA